MQVFESLLTDEQVKFVMAFDCGVFNTFTVKRLKQRQQVTQLLAMWLCDHVDMTDATQTLIDYFAETDLLATVIELLISRGDET